MNKKGTITTKNQVFISLFLLIVFLNTGCKNTAYEDLIKKEGAKIGQKDTLFRDYFWFKMPTDTYREKFFDLNKKGIAFENNGSPCIALDSTEGFSGKTILQINPHFTEKGELDELQLLFRYQDLLPPAYEQDVQRMTPEAMQYLEKTYGEFLKIEKHGKPIVFVNINHNRQIRCSPTKEGLKVWINDWKKKREKK